GVTDAQVFLGTHVGGHDLAGMVREAWDLDDVGRRYEQFLADFARATTRDALTRIVELVHAWRRFPALDPALPRQLLPAQWSGTKAAKLFARQHARLAVDATLEWRRISAEAD
ncbi:MAG: PaaX family transcriptional regulator C-terminal domain-containing protein, partial [Pseudonocardiales bacterium]